MDTVLFQIQVGCRSENLVRVLNPSFYPSTLEDGQLFHKQCSFISCVLNGHVTFSPAATRFESDQYTGQKVWNAIVTEFNENMYGELRRE